MALSSDSAVDGCDLSMRLGQRGADRVIVPYQGC